MGAFKRLLACLAALLPLGCGNFDVVVYSVTGSPFSYFQGEFEYATHKGAIVADVGGNPFAITNDEFAALVRGHLHGATFSPDVDFVAGPSARTMPPYRVIAMFNAAPYIGPLDLCKDGTAVPTAAVKGKTRFNLVFCYGEHLKVETAGAAWGIAGPNDPKLRKLIRQVAITLIPLMNDKDGDDNPVIIP